MPATRVLPLDPTTYQRHLIHGENRTWVETNCYTDVLVELLHGMGFEPMAALPFTFAAGFEGDQWTFFKFHPADLEVLYGLSLHELAPWRPLAVHIAEQLSLGRPVLVELDSYFLPDTAGTAYKLAHVKSTIAANEIDLEGQRLGYFHNQGYHALEGQDFADIFQTGGLVHERMMPPFIEFVRRMHRHQPLSKAQQLEASLAILKRHLARVPETNPFPAFKAAFERDMDWLLASDIEVFHAYSFATLRQYGACFELSATYLRWLSGEGVDGLDEATGAFNGISQSTKALQFQLARAMARKRALDLATLDEMGATWTRGMDLLTSRFA